jgi:hypothetical protein
MKGETPEALVERILEDSKMLEQVVENEDRSPLEMQFTRDLLDATFRLGEVLRKVLDAPRQLRRADHGTRPGGGAMLERLNCIANGRCSANRLARINHQCRLVSRLA